MLFNWKGPDSGDEGRTHVSPLNGLAFSLVNVPVPSKSDKPPVPCDAAHQISAPECLPLHLTGELLLGILERAHDHRVLQV